MAIPFPAIKPTTIDFSPGEYPNDAPETLGFIYTTRDKGDVPNEAEISAGFENISDAEAMEILDCYRLSRAGVHSLELPAEIAAGIVSTPLRTRILGTDLEWHFKEKVQPQVDSKVSPGRKSVRIQLVGRLVGLPIVITPRVDPGPGSGGGGGAPGVAARGFDLDFETYTFGRTVDDNFYGSWRMIDEISGPAGVITPAFPILGMSDKIGSVYEFGAGPGYFLKSDGTAAVLADEKFFFSAVVSLIGLGFEDRTIWSLNTDGPVFKLTFTPAGFLQFWCDGVLVNQVGTGLVGVIGPMLVVVRRRADGGVMVRAGSASASSWESIGPYAFGADGHILGALKYPTESESMLGYIDKVRFLIGVDEDDGTMVPPPVWSLERMLPPANGFSLFFTGPDDSTEIIDDAGATWTAMGEAKLSTSPTGSHNGSSLSCIGLPAYAVMGGSSAAIGADEAFTFRARIWLPTSAPSGVFRCIWGAGDVGVGLYVSAGGSLYWFDYLNGSIEADSGMPRNQWMRVRITKFVGGTVEMSMNGIIVANELAGPTAGFGGTGHLIGSSIYGETFGGYIDHARLDVGETIYDANY